MSEIAATSTAFPFKQNPDIFGLHDKGIPAVNVIANDRFKLAYVPIPKVACTAMKLLFFYLRTGHQFADRFNAIHTKFDYKTSDFTAFAADSEYFKFAVVRDPLERFVSAFNSRVLFYQELSEEWFQKNWHSPPQIHAKFGAKSLKFNPTINEFVQRFDDYSKVSVRIQHHFVPQYFFLNGKPEAFDKIYNIHQLRDLMNELGTRVGETVGLQNVQETKGLENMARASDLSSAEKAQILEIYKEDYVLLNGYL